MPTMATLAQKFETLHAAEDSVRKALADLIDPSTGEAIAPGEFAFDVTSKMVFVNESGRCVRKKAAIIPAAKPTS